MSQLGFAPVIPIAIKAVPAIVGLLGGKKKAEAEKRMSEYLSNEQQIASGQAVMATDVMTPADIAFLRKVWPEIRVAASFDHPNWAAHGYPGGPQLTPAALAAIRHVWPQVRVAASFDDVNWQYHAVPNEIVGRLLPLPELGYQVPGGTATPGGAAVPGGTAPGYYDPYALYAQAQQSRILPGAMIPGLSTDTLIIISAVGVGLLLLFGDRR